MIYTDRIETELRELKKHCDVDHDPGLSWVVVKQVDFPSGWNPGQGDILFKLPKTYPLVQPKVFMPDKMRYNGKRPHIMLRGPPSWSRFCLHDFEFNPEYHTLITVLRMIKKSLEHPHGKHLFE